MIIMIIPIDGFINIYLIEGICDDDDEISSKEASVPKTTLPSQSAISSGVNISSSSISIIVNISISISISISITITCIQAV